jgi:hypothetical protein
MSGKLVGKSMLSPVPHLLIDFHLKASSSVERSQLWFSSFVFVVPNRMENYENSEELTKNRNLLLSQMSENPR